MKNNISGPPFSLLTPEEEKDLAQWFSFETIKAGEMVLVQEFSPVEKLYILSKGAAAYYFEQDRIRLLKGTLGPGDNFGGLSILLNDGIAVRSLETLEETVFLTIEAESFLSLCSQNRAFQDWFTGRFGHLMLDPTFAAIIAGQARGKAMSLPYFNRPVSAILRPHLVTCTEDTPLNEAIQKMGRQDFSAILIKNNDKKVSGIVTDADLRARALAKGLPPDTPISRIMSTPLVSISADSQVFEAYLTMLRHDSRHLALRGKSGDISGIITQKDLIQSQTQATYLLIKSVRFARTMTELENIHAKLCHMLLDPIRHGVNAEYITRLITTFSDAILEKVMEFCLEEAGPPPCKFVFLTMGSEGREEQTLISDQDNAIVFQDLETEPEQEAAKTYFDHLARLICTRLDMAGYKFCDGDNMAQNPKWCQPLSQWKTYFHQWIRKAKPEDLLYSSIFFDFKGTYGHLELADELKAYLLKSIRGWSGFLRNMTENALYFSPPIGLFGKIKVETEGAHKNAFDIKYAMLPIIDVTRVYALQNGIAQTNTLNRLFRLYTRHAITAKEYTDVTQAYDYLMKLRFRRQITTLMDEQAQPDNYINPDNLSGLDRTMLREIFKMIEKLQQKLGIEFTGVT